MTRGGLGGIQDNTGRFNRQVQDKTYFNSLLRFAYLNVIEAYKTEIKIINTVSFRAKLTEISVEIGRMNKEITNINSDNSNYQAYGKK